MIGFILAHVLVRQMIVEHLLVPVRAGPLPTRADHYLPTWIYKEHFIYSDIEAIARRLLEHNKVPASRKKFGPPPLESTIKDEHGNKPVIKNLSEEVFLSVVACNLGMQSCLLWYSWL